MQTIELDGEIQPLRRRVKREPGLKRQQRKLRDPTGRGMPPAAIEALKRGDFGWKKTERLDACILRRVIAVARLG